MEVSTSSPHAIQERTVSLCPQSPPLRSSSSPLAPCAFPICSKALQASPPPPFFPSPAFGLSVSPSLPSPPLRLIIRKKSF